MPVDKQTALESSKFMIGVEAKIAVLMEVVVNNKPEEVEAILRDTLVKLKPAYVSRMLLAGQIRTFRETLPSIMSMAGEPDDRIEALDRYLGVLQSKIQTF